MPTTSSVSEVNTQRILPQAVLWDLDGTLIDTEPYWIAAEHALVTAHGGSWSEEQAHALVGAALPDSARTLQAAGVNMGVREIIDHLTGEVIAGLRREIPWRPGALELLRANREAGIAQALVTMSERSIVDIIVAAMPEGLFDVTVAGDEVTAGKPNPTPYLRGLQLLSEKLGREFTAERCIGLEDSLPGITAASGAGLHAVLIPNATDPGTGQWRRVSTLAGVTPVELAGWLETAVA